MNVNSQGGGKRLQMTFEPGMRHLMRFINTGVDNFYKIGLGKSADDPEFHRADELPTYGHMMQVVAIDLQPVQPYYSQYVSLGVGKSIRLKTRLFHHLNKRKVNDSTPSSPQITLLETIGCELFQCLA